MKNDIDNSVLGAIEKKASIVKKMKQPTQQTSCSCFSKTTTPPLDNTESVELKKLRLNSEE